MADSDAVRSRRKRAHAAGDHSLCRRCKGLSAPGPVPAPPAPGDARVDPGASLERLAARLEAAHEANPSDAAVARVLKDVLVVLRGPGETADRELAEFAAEFSGA
jgi:hypothetical protein